MNPDTKFLLDEMTKRLDSHDAKLEQRLGDLDVKLDQRLRDRDEFLEQDLDAEWDDQLASFSASNDKRVSRIESAASTFDGWRQEIEGTVDDIRLNVGKLSKICERSAVEKPIDMTGGARPDPIFGGCRAPICCWQHGRPAQWAPRRLELTGRWFWSCYNSGSSPGQCVHCT